MATEEKITETEFLRSEVQRYREAALIGFGVLSARNEDGKATDVLSVMSKYLFPTLSQPCDATDK